MGFSKYVAILIQFVSKTTNVLNISNGLYKQNKECIVMSSGLKLNSYPGILTHYQGV